MPKKQLCSNNKIKFYIKFLFYKCEPITTSCASSILLRKCHEKEKIYMYTYISMFLYDIIVLV